MLGNTEAHSWLACAADSGEAVGHRTGRGFSQGQLVGSSNAPLKTSQFILRAESSGEPSRGFSQESDRITCTLQKDPSG